MTFTHADDWDPLFAQRSPMFEAFARPCAQWRDGPGFPDRQRCAAALDAVPVRNSSGRALQLAEPADAAGAWGYERSIAESAELGFRQGNWHDLMNLLVWCVFPQSKARLNAAHLADPAGCARPAARWAAPPRSALRDALTLFDENGVIVASADPSLEPWERFCDGAAADADDADQREVLGIGTQRHRVLLRRPLGGSIG